MQTETIKGRLALIQGVTVNDVVYSSKGYSLDVKAATDTILQVVTEIDQAGFFIEAITGVDWLGEKAALKKEADDKAKAAAAAAATATEGEQQPSLPVNEPLTLQEDEMEIVYDFNHYNSFCRLTVRVRVPRSNPKIPTISAIYPGADWHERETHDFFGIKFIGHPNLIPLLLPEDSDFHPLLKDFKA
jgi:NADH-quinone oxidoreductase subunit C